MAELRALIAAAGRGTRAGLPYPKTLFPIAGEPILVRIMNLLAPYDSKPTVVASPDGVDLMRECLGQAGMEAEIVVQPVPAGMGDAVLCFAQSPACATAEHVLLIWGDIPFIQPETVEQVIAAHLAQENDLTFATRHVEAAYTRVTRDGARRVTGLSETREAGTPPEPGERDIGLFVFRNRLMLDLLREDLPGKFGRLTGEHGFLYAVGHLVDRGHRVEALALATELDLVSLNSMQDIAAFIEPDC